MNDLVQRLRIALCELARSPRGTARELGRQLLGRLLAPGQPARLQALTRQAPLILQIETTNACNAVCVFCARSRMQRAVGVMPLPLFEKIVRDYAGMGGGPVSLTPVVGDALLDPHLLERLRLLRELPGINQVSLTTNAIALENYSDPEVCRLLESLYCLQVSIGGLDPRSYRTMFGVDRFPQVRRALDRLMRLNAGLPRPAHLTFAFRSNDWKFEARHRQELAEFRRRGVHINHIWSYANYSGQVASDAGLGLVVQPGGGKKRRACLYASVALSVCWDGAVTACGCADFEGNRLALGSAASRGLAQIWHGAGRAALLDAFGKGSLSSICRQCSAYQPDAAFAKPCFKEVRPHQPLPLEFYHHLWGG